MLLATDTVKLRRVKVDVTVAGDLVPSEHEYYLVLFRERRFFADIVLGTSYTCVKSISAFAARCEKLRMSVAGSSAKRSNQFKIVVAMLRD